VRSKNVVYSCDNWKDVVSLLKTLYGNEVHEKVVVEVVHYLIENRAITQGIPDDWINVLKRYNPEEISSMINFIYDRTEEVARKGERPILDIHVIGSKNEVAIDVYNHHGKLVDSFIVEMPKGIALEERNPGFMLKINK